MDIALVISRAIRGIDAPRVSVEVHLSHGLPSLSIVGLPETAVRESRERVRSALLNNQFNFPRGRITINLAPADLPKEGGRYDLAIAIGILAASGQVADAPLPRLEFLGELALGGALRPVRGVLPAARVARDAGRALILPRENAREAGLVRGLTVLPAGHLGDICAHLNGAREISPAPADPGADDDPAGPDLSDVVGQHQARRALEIAAAGGHHLLMAGPPGTGKTMLAERLPGILPSMDEAEAIESAAVWSISSRGFRATRWRQRPFRAPHHTASAIALVGGGSPPRPGEISLAHHGVLFLDELPEFQRRALEVLREPLESGRIVVSRAAWQTEFPADFQLVAAMNPCPCGFLGDPGGRCACTDDRVSRYRARISGPLLDRIDLHVAVPNISGDLLGPGGLPGECSSAVRERVARARARQAARAGRTNSRLNNREVARDCSLDPALRAWLRTAMDRLGLSARALQRVLKVSRTIADLEGAGNITRLHLAEAVSYRPPGTAASS